MLVETATLIWWVTVAIFFVVIIVVAILLSLILSTAKTIQNVVADIWTAGKMVANNTIHIPLLIETNSLAGNILNEVGQIVDGAVIIQEHAEKCPGCPDCVLRI